MPPKKLRNTWYVSSIMWKIEVQIHVFMWAGRLYHPFSAIFWAPLYAIFLRILQSFLDSKSFWTTRADYKNLQWIHLHVLGLTEAYGTIWYCVRAATGTHRQGLTVCSLWITRMHSSATVSPEGLHEKSQWQGVSLWIVLSSRIFMGEKRLWDTSSHAQACLVPVHRSL